MDKRETEELTVKDALKRLNNFYKIRIGYTGLMYYRNLGLIDPPQRVAGYKERFYNIDDLVARINAIKLIADIFAINFEDMAGLAKKLPHETFNKLPLVFIKMYSNATDGIGNSEEKMNREVAESPATFRIASKCFLDKVKEMSSKAEGNSSEEFYYSVVEKAFRKEFLYEAALIEDVLEKMRKTKMKL